MKCIIIGIYIMMIFISLTVSLYAQTDFTKDSLIKYMEGAGIQFIPLTLGQAIHETGNFRSDLFKNNHNLFGMRVPIYRKTTAIGTRKGYAVYASWEDSVLDFYFFQQNVLKKHPSYSQYISYIFRNYAKDPLYKQKLQKYIK